MRLEYLISSMIVKLSVTQCVMFAVLLLGASKLYPYSLQMDQNCSQTKLNISKYSSDSKRQVRATFVTKSYFPTIGKRGVCTYIVIQFIHFRSCKGFTYS